MSTAIPAATSSALSKTFSAERRTFPALDGLRGLAIALVLWHHLYVVALAAPFGAMLFFPPAASFAFAGVFLFFVLSGFLLFLPYARALLDDAPWPSARRFYQRRALRILPAYYVALGIQAAARSPTVFSSPTLILLVVLLGDVQPQAVAAANTINIALWSLMPEWQFYLVLPVLAWGLARLARTGAPRGVLIRLLIGLTAIMLLGLAIRTLAAWWYYGGQGQPVAMPGLGGLLWKVVYGNKGKYLECFAVGMGVSVCYVWWERLGRWGSVTWPFLLASLLALLGCGVWAWASGRLPLSPQPDSLQSIFPHGISWAIAGEWSMTCCFGLLLWGVLCGGGRRVFTFPPLRWLGHISYSLYLWHMVVLIPAALLSQNALQFLVVGSGCTLVLAALSYVLIERPFLRWRRATRATRPASR